MTCFNDSSLREDPFESILAAQDVSEKPALAGRPGEEEMQTRLKDLQGVLRDNKLDWYIVPSEDEHQSEYTGDTENRREWISNFNGSAGTAIIPASSEDKAILFVDSRYWVIAEQQVPKSHWRVERVGSTGGSGKGSVVSGWTDWIVSQSSAGLRIGLDPKLIGYTTATDLYSRLEASTKLVSVDRNLVDAVRQPVPRPLGPITPHPLKYAGETSWDKIARIRKTLAGKGDNWIFLLPALPSIAWLLNIRCMTDIPKCPVPYAYCVLTESECVLFVDDRKVPGAMRAVLDESKVTLRPYGVDEVGKYVKEAKEKLRVVDEKAHLRISGGAETSWGLASACGGDVEIIQCPVEVAKAIKNRTEQEGFRYSYLRDGRAFVRWLSWLETKLMKENREIGEWAASQTLARFRMQEALYMSGGAGISASGPNAALPHYEPEQGADQKIDREAVFLEDSGVQYEDGTIDTTRTVYFGKSPSDEIKRAYTRVLQCHMNVLTATFPSGMGSDQLVMLGKAPLFKEGMNFGHGLGHGVGSFLGVHEYPYFSPSRGTPFEPGHVVTVEPGWYLEGKYGIRTESLVLCRKVDTTYNFGGQWLGFERITQVPIQTKLIDWSLMTKDEIRWINDHNTAVQEALWPSLQGEQDKEVREWLKRECKPKRIWPWTGA